MAEFILGVILGLTIARYKASFLGLFKRADQKIQKGIDNSLK